MAKRVTVINVGSAPWGSGDFGVQLRERWSVFTTELLCSPEMASTFKLICWDRGIDPDTIAEEAKPSFIRDAVAEYLRREPIYVSALMSWSRKCSVSEVK